MFLMMSLFVVSLCLWAFCSTFESVCILCICVYHISAPSFKMVSSNPLWSESLSLSLSLLWLDESWGTRQTSHPSFSGTFFISFFFAALFNNHVSFCGYYMSFSSLWALVCIPLSSRWVFLVLLSLWGNYLSVVVLLGYFEFGAVMQSFSVCLSLLLSSLLMNIFDWVLSSFRFYHYSAVHVLGFIRVSLYAVAKSLSLY